MIELGEDDSLWVVVPGMTGERNEVRLTMLHKSGRRARIRVVAGADVLIHRDVDKKMAQPA